MDVKRGSCFEFGERDSQFVRDLQYYTRYAFRQQMFTVIVPSPNYMLNHSGKKHFLRFSGD